MKYGGQDIPGSPFDMNSGKDGTFQGDSLSKSRGGMEGRKNDSSPLGGSDEILLLDLIKARNLVKADMIGKSDPYAVLKFGKQKDKTNIIKNTVDPQWDHHAEFKVPESGADKLIVEVFDADKIGKDKSLGKVELDIDDLPADVGHWFPLQGRKLQLYNKHI